MTGLIIPPDQWPEGAVMHAWDEDGAGHWVMHAAGDWLQWPSEIPLPADWDWRVPVMREQAPAIDLEQFRARIVAAIDRITGGYGLMRVPADSTDPDLVLGDILALIDGQARGCDEAADVWGTQYPNKAIKLFGARELAELNWYPEEGAALVGLRVVERVQPAKGEGE